MGEKTSREIRWQVCSGNDWKKRWRRSSASLFASHVLLKFPPASTFFTFFILFFSLSSSLLSLSSQNTSDYSLLIEDDVVAGDGALDSVMEIVRTLEKRDDPSWLYVKLFYVDSENSKRERLEDEIRKERRRLLLVMQSFSFMSVWVSSVEYRPSSLWILSSHSLSSFLCSLLRITFRFFLVLLCLVDLSFSYIVTYLLFFLRSSQSGTSTTRRWWFSAFSASLRCSVSLSFDTSDLRIPFAFVCWFSTWQQYCCLCSSLWESRTSSLRSNEVCCAPMFSVAVK